MTLIDTLQRKEGKEMSLLLLLFFFSRKDMTLTLQVTSKEGNIMTLLFYFFWKINDSTHKIQIDLIVICPSLVA